MQSIFGSIAKLLGHQSISNDEILQVLRNHEARIKDLEAAMEARASEIEERFKGISKKTQEVKKQATKDLEQLRAELDSLLGAIEIVVAGELAPARMNEIKQLKKLAKGRRTRVKNIIESRVH